MDPRKMRSKKNYKIETEATDSPIQGIMFSTAMIVSTYFNVAPTETESNDHVSDSEVITNYRQPSVFLFSPKHLQDSADHINPVEKKSNARGFSR